MKRLYRSRKDKIIAGVCAGIGRYFDIDPVIVRIIAIVLFFWGGSGIIAYIIAVIVIPLEPEPDQMIEKKTTRAKSAAGEEKPETVAGTPSNTGALIAGIVLILLGGIFLLRNFPFFDHYYWWFRHQIGHIFWPAVLIAFGAFMIVRGTRK
jgi:phage shock protein C